MAINIVCFVLELVCSEIPQIIATAASAVRTDTYQRPPLFFISAHLNQTEQVGLVKPPAEVARPAGIAELRLTRSANRNQLCCPLCI